MSRYSRRENCRAYVQFEDTCHATGTNRPTYVVETPTCHQYHAHTIMNGAFYGKVLEPGSFRVKAYAHPQIKQVEDAAAVDSSYIVTIVRAHYEALQGR